MVANKLASESYNGRSRKGAWIEIPVSAVLHTALICRSRKGAWIEIEP